MNDDFFLHSTKIACDLIPVYIATRHTYFSVEHLKRGAIKETDGQASQLSGLAD